MRHLDILSIFDYEMANAYLGQLPAIIVLDAYEAAFSSAQRLDQEKDLLDAIIKAYFKADDVTKKRFCHILDERVTFPFCSE